MSHRRAQNVDDQVHLVGSDRCEKGFSLGGRATKARPAKEHLVKRDIQDPRQTNEHLDRRRTLCSLQLPEEVLSDPESFGQGFLAHLSMRSRRGDGQTEAPREFFVRVDRHPPAESARHAGVSATIPRLSILTI